MSTLYFNRNNPLQFFFYWPTWIFSLRRWVVLQFVVVTGRGKSGNQGWGSMQQLLWVKDVNSKHHKTSQIRVWKSCSGLENKPTEGNRKPGKPKIWLSFQKWEWTLWRMFLDLESLNCKTHLVLQSRQKWYERAGKVVLSTQGQKPYLIFPFFPQPIVYSLNCKYIYLLLSKYLILSFHAHWQRAFCSVWRNF